jgi:hypothetical protein
VKSRNPQWSKRHAQLVRKRTDGGGLTEIHQCVSGARRAEDFTFEGDPSPDDSHAVRLRHDHRCTLTTILEASPRTIDQQTRVAAVLVEE